MCILKLYFLDLQTPHLYVTTLNQNSKSPSVPDFDPMMRAATDQSRFPVVFDKWQALNNDINMAAVAPNKDGPTIFDVFNFA